MRFSCFQGVYMLMSELFREQQLILNTLTKQRFSLNCPHVSHTLLSLYQS